MATKKSRQIVYTYETTCKVSFGSQYMTLKCDYKNVTAANALLQEFAQLAETVSEKIELSTITFQTPGRAKATIKSSTEVLAKMSNMLFGTPKPEATTESKPEATTESKPEATTESKPEATTESKPEATTESKPESTTESKPKATTESKPKATTESKPKATTESKPKATTESKPKATTESKPKATTESKPKATTESKPKATNISPPRLRIAAASKFARYELDSILPEFGFDFGEKPSVDEENAYEFVFTKQDSGNKTPLNIVKNLADSFVKVAPTISDDILTQNYSLINVISNVVNAFICKQDCLDAAFNFATVCTEKDSQIPSYFSDYLLFGRRMSSKVSVRSYVKCSEMFDMCPGIYEKTVKYMIERFSNEPWWSADQDENEGIRFHDVNEVICKWFAALQVMFGEVGTSVVRVV